MSPAPPLPPRRRATPPAPAGRARWRSSEFFGQRIEIEHGGAIYRLRRTSQGELILTK